MGRGSVFSWFILLRNKLINYIFQLPIIKLKQKNKGINHQQIEQKEKPLFTVFINNQSLFKYQQILFPIKMQKDKHYSVYTTPFKFKSKSQPKITHQNQPNFMPNFNTLVNSPYTKYRSRKINTAHVRQSVESLNQFSSKMKFRVNSAPHNAQYKRKKINKNQLENLLSEEEKIEMDSLMTSQERVRTFRKVVQGRAYNRRINLQKQLNFSPKSQYVSKKFTATTKNAQKQKEKHQNRNLVDKKLEKYNYKTVLGENITIGSTKIPKILIDQYGTITRVRS